MMRMMLSDYIMMMEQKVPNLVFIIVLLLRGIHKT